MRNIGRIALGCAVWLAWLAVLAIAAVAIPTMALVRKMRGRP